MKNYTKQEPTTQRNRCTVARDYLIICIDQLCFNSSQKKKKDNCSRAAEKDLAKRNSRKAVQSLGRMK